MAYQMFHKRVAVTAGAATVLTTETISGLLYGFQIEEINFDIATTDFTIVTATTRIPIATITNIGTTTLMRMPMMRCHGTNGAEIDRDTSTKLHTFIPIANEQIEIQIAQAGAGINGDCADVYFYVNSNDYT